MIQPIIKGQEGRDCCFIHVLMIKMLARGMTLSIAKKSKKTKKNKRPRETINQVNRTEDHISHFHQRTKYLTFFNVSFYA